MNATRSKAQQNIYGGSVAQDYAFNQQAGAMKVMGLIFGRVKVFMGDLATAKQADAGALVAVYNNTAAAIFVATGNSSIAAPTSANGIAIPPNSYLIIPMGDDNYIRASGAGAIGYWLQDDLIQNANSGANS